MKRVVKLKIIKLLMILALVMGLCPVAFTINDSNEAVYPIEEVVEEDSAAVKKDKQAEPADGEQPKKEVLTALEQNMLKRVTIDLRDTPIDDVIRVLADQADVDIIKSIEHIVGTRAGIRFIPGHNLKI